MKSSLLLTRPGHTVVGWSARVTAAINIHSLILHSRVTCACCVASCASCSGVWSSPALLSADHNISANLTAMSPKTIAFLSLSRHYWSIIKVEKVEGAYLIICLDWVLKLRKRFLSIDYLWSTLLSFIKHGSKAVYSFLLGLSCVLIWVGFWWLCDYYSWYVFVFELR